jgi:hypothetical protein
MRATSAVAADKPLNPNKAAISDTTNIIRAHFNNVDMASGSFWEAKPKACRLVPIEIVRTGLAGGVPDE